MIMNLAINPLLPVEKLAAQRPLRVGYRLLDPCDEAAMIDYLKLALRPSPERRARVAAMRRERLSDVQYDADIARDEAGERTL